MNRKQLSQNFLIDDAIIEKIVEFSEVLPGDKVLEIGPGSGAITKRLLAAGAQVIAVEKDPFLAERLRDPRLQIYCGDILAFPIENLGTSLKVVSNIPFKITARILDTLCAHIDQFTSIVLIVQKEVADKIKAKPKTKAFGPLALLLQFYTTYIADFPIPRASFSPEPTVDVTAIKLRRRESLPEIDPNRFFDLVKKAFQQRRKMLAPLKKRPEELNLEEWISFFNMSKA